MFVIPFSAIILFQILNGINKNIDFAEHELAGDAYQRALEPLLEKIPQYGLSVKRGDSAGLKDSIDECFDRLDAAQGKLGSVLAVNSEGFKEAGQDPVLPGTLRTEWQKVVQLAGISSSGSDFSKAIDGLTGDLLTLVSYIGNSSNLILDPELDSYYLGDFTLNKMPQTQNRLATIIKRLSEVDFSAQDPAIKQEFSVYSAMLEQDDLNPALSDISTCLASNGPKIHGKSPTLQSNLPLALQTYKDANTTLLSALQKWLGGQSNDTPLQPMAEKARAESFKVWTVAAQEMDVLLQRRIQAFQNERLLDIALTVMAIGLAGWIARRIVRRISTDLSQISDNLTQTSQKLSGASIMLSKSSHSIADGSSEQAAALEETSASLEEIFSMGKNNATSASSARERTTEARGAAEEGATRTQEMQAAMSGVKAASEEMENAILGIMNSSNNVSKIIKTIDEIAFQTNILALNAAVEAARAGEAGAGFAVVADEVRNLAQRSAEAAKETAQMIEGSVQQSTRGVEVNQKVSSRLSEIIGLSHQVQASLTNIVTKIRQVDDLVATISNGAKEQTIGLEQITGAVNQLDRSTQNAAAVADDTAQTSEVIAHEAETLIADIEILKTLIRGAAGA